MRAHLARLTSAIVAIGLAAAPAVAQPAPGAGSGPASTSASASASDPDATDDTALPSSSSSSPPASSPSSPPASAEAVAEAQRLLEEGRHLFADDADYAEALDRFHRSYRLWPNWHAINGIALVHQQQGLFVEAYDTYERLLVEFDAALTEDQAARVERRLAALRSKVGVVELRASQVGAHVLLDGHEIGVGPVKTSVRVLPGSHTVVATSAGHEPLTRSILVVAGGSVGLDIELHPQMISVEQAHLVRPIKPWIPWVTAGAGIAVLGVGVLVRLDASSDFDHYQDRVRQTWETDQRPVALEDESLLHTAQQKNAVAITMMIGGGAAALTGAVLAALNQPRTVIESRRVPRVVPLPGGAALSFKF